MGRKMVGKFAIILFALCCATTSIAKAEKRVALVIGNSHYESLSDIANAEIDASRVAAKLGTLGFSVTLLKNTQEREMIRAFHKHKRLLSNGAVGVFYYAGRVIQHAGKNFLVPTDANPELPEDLESETIPLAKLFEVIVEAGNSLNIFIFEANHPNPINIRGQKLKDGMAVAVLPIYIKNTAIVYAAEPGKVSLPLKTNSISLFTSALLSNLDEPKANLNKVLQKTRADVYRRSKNKQRPWQLTSMDRDFVLNNKPLANPVKSQSRKSLSSKTETLFWNSVKDSNDATVLQSYLQVYPDGAHVVAAREKISALIKLPVKQLNSGQTRSPVFHKKWYGYGTECVTHSDDSTSIYRVDLFLFDKKFRAEVTRQTQSSNKNLITRGHGSFDLKETRNLTLSDGHVLSVAYNKNEEKFEAKLTGGIFYNCRFVLAKEVKKWKD